MNTEITTEVIKTYTITMDQTGAEALLKLIGKLSPNARRQAFGLTDNEQDAAEELWEQLRAENQGFRLDGPMVTYKDYPANVNTVILDHFPG